MKYATIDAKGLPTAFFDDAIHKQIPADAVAIPDDIWRKHISGQKQQYTNGAWGDYQPTPEELAALEQQRIEAVRNTYSAAAQQRINAELAAREYDNEAQLATYATTANPYQTEAKALQDWIVSTVWPAWEALDPAALDPKGAEAWAAALPSPQV